MGDRRRLLMVDDDRALLDAVKRLLSAEFDVSTLSDPIEAATRLLDGERFDAILLDVRMPPLDGGELYEMIRRISPDQAMRVIFISGERLAARVDGRGHAYLAKPFSRGALIDALSSVTEANPTSSQR